TPLANHDHQFTLVVDFVAAKLARQEDRPPRGEHRAARLHEHDWIFWYWLVPLGGMLGVVEPDAKNVDRFERSQPFALLDRLLRIAKSSEQLSLEPCEPALGMLGDQAIFSLASYNPRDSHADP